MSASIVFEDDDVVAFHDISPQAPVHILIIPKQHISSPNQFSNQNQNLIGKMMNTASVIAKEKGIDDDWYRLVMNCNQHGGQTVFHVHLHLLGGRQLHWPPG